eukprot:889272_1
MLIIHSRRHSSRFDRCSYSAPLPQNAMIAMIAIHILTPFLCLPSLSIGDLKLVGGYFECQDMLGVRIISCLWSMLGGVLGVDAMFVSVVVAMRCGSKHPVTYVDMMQYVLIAEMLSTVIP